MNSDVTLFISLLDLIGLAVLAVMAVPVLLLVVAIFVKERMKQYKCPHENYYETMSCDAICSNCGKNLGFIGNVRDKK